jgi:hypothetical protein
MRTGVKALGRDEKIRGRCGRRCAITSPTWVFGKTAERSFFSCSFGLGKGNRGSDWCSKRGTRRSRRTDRGDYVATLREMRVIQVSNTMVLFFAW